MSVHLAQKQSFQRQNRLCPFSAETIPWLRQRAHLGVRWNRSCPLPPPAPLMGEVEDEACDPDVEERSGKVGLLIRFIVDLTLWKLQRGSC